MKTAEKRPGGVGSRFFIQRQCLNRAAGDIAIHIADIIFAWAACREQAADHYLYNTDILFSGTVCFPMKNSIEFFWAFPCEPQDSFRRILLPPESQEKSSFCSIWGRQPCQSAPKPARSSDLPSPMISRKEA